MGQGKKTPQYFTVMILPDKGTRVRKISIPKGWVHALPLFSLGLGLMILLLVGLFFHYRHGHLAHLGSQEEVLKMRHTMDEVHAQVAMLEQNLDRLSSFDTKLRMMTDLQDPARQLAMGPLSLDINEDQDDEADSPFNEVMPYLDLEGTPKNPDEILVTAKHLNTRSETQERSLIQLIDRMRNREIRLASTPAVWPIQGYLTSKFGMRISPFTGQRKFHAGIDIGASPGTPVYAPADGTVLFVGSRAGYGHTLIIGHGYGLVTCYAHNSKVTVEKGQQVKRGDLIAQVGNTGRSTGPHLHYEVRLNGKAEDPRLFILN
jgi:murein DD-endopeptidase MepM/ murein hydrolase activator NlpD